MRVSVRQVRDVIALTSNYERERDRQTERDRDRETERERERRGKRENKRCLKEYLNIHIAPIITERQNRNKTH